MAPLVFAGALYLVLLFLPGRLGWGGIVGAGACLVIFGRDLASRPEPFLRELFAVVLASLLATAVVAAAVVRTLRAAFPGRLAGRTDAAVAALVPVLAFGGTLLILSAARS